MNRGSVMCHIHWSRTEQSSVLSMREMFSDNQRLAVGNWPDYWSRISQIPVFMKAEISQFVLDFIDVLISSKDFSNFSWPFDR